MFSLRAGGAALACPHARRRLADLAEAQLHEVCARLQKIAPQHCPSMDTDRSGAPGRCMGAIFMDRATQLSIEALKRIRGEEESQRLVVTAQTARLRQCIASRIDPVS